MKIFAHRGYSLKYPENTLLAFQQARDFADYIELDVALTADHQVVVMHDDGLERTTNLQGQVAETSWAEIAQADAGSWKHLQYSHCRVPLLEEVLVELAAHMPINVEIKASSVKLDPDVSIENFILPLLKGWMEKGQILVSSFEPLALHRLRSASPQLPLAYLTDESPSADQQMEMQYLACQAHHINIDHVTKHDVQWAHANGFEVNTYTVNQPSQWRKALDLKVDGIFTDDPLAFSQLRQKMHQSNKR